MSCSYILYSSIWCPMEEIRGCIKKGQRIFKEMIDSIKEYEDDEGIVFLELTEDALRNLPVHMVDNMKCFDQYNIDTMAFNIKEIKCPEECIESLKRCWEGYMLKLQSAGFKCEVIIIKEIKIEEENVGKTVTKKDYSIWYQRQFA